MAKRINIQKDVESRRRISQGVVPDTTKEEIVKEPVKEPEDAQSEAVSGTEADEALSPLHQPKKGRRKTQGDS